MLRICTLIFIPNYVILNEIILFINSFYLMILACVIVEKIPEEDQAFLQWGYSTTSIRYISNHAWTRNCKSDHIVNICLNV